MRPRPLLPALATATALAVVAPPRAEAAVCPPARLGPGGASLVEPWRRAAAELVEASATPGQPWSCGGGVIELRPHDGGATLIVTSADGHATAREVADPDEVVPLGEALLSLPLPPAPALAAPAASPDALAPKAAPLAEPRVLVSALVVPRYAGSTNAIWGGLTAAVGVPIGAWGVGAWGRYDGPMVALRGPSPALHEFAIGASAWRSFQISRLELRAGVTPSVGVVTREGTMKGDPDETRVDGRIGVEARAVLPIIPLLRAVAAFDLELSPRELAEGDGHKHGGGTMPLPDFPSYTLGLGLGLEVAIR